VRCAVCATRQHRAIRHSFENIMLPSPSSPTIIDNEIFLEGDNL